LVEDDAAVRDGAAEEERQLDAGDEAETDGDEIAVDVALAAADDDGGAGDAIGAVDAADVGVAPDRNAGEPRRQEGCPGELCRVAGEPEAETEDAAARRELGDADDAGAQAAEAGGGGADEGTGPADEHALAPHRPAVLGEELEAAGAEHTGERPAGDGKEQ